MNQEEMWNEMMNDWKNKENDIIKFINNNRKYPKINIKKENLIIQYKNNNKLYEKYEDNDKNNITMYNERVEKCRFMGLRLMTWNMHFFTNVDTNSNMEEILDVIKKINPDILCLNEVTTNKTEYNNKDLPLQIGNLINFSFCSITPLTTA
jgi:hypothetical protein